MTDLQPEDDENPFEGLDETPLKDDGGEVVPSREGAELVLTRVPNKGRDSPFEALRFNPRTGLLRIFPMAYQHGHIEQQFEQFREIQLEGATIDVNDHSFLSTRSSLYCAEGLPEGFKRTYEYGLGISRDYVGFVRGIEERTSATVLRLTPDAQEGFDETTGIFRVSLGRFNEHLGTVQRTKGRAQTATRRVLDADTHNAVASLFGLENVKPKFGRNPVIQVLTEEVATGHVTSTEDRLALADALTTEAKKLGEDAPQRLVQLRDDIELVSLDDLIDRFEADLDGPHLADEPHWQKFFSTNQFALQLIFSTPIVIVQEQAHVQDPDVRGKGARIADFLCANAITRTAVIVEIKTPGAVLMRTKPYRGEGSDAAVHAPDKNLVGPVAQLQSQMASVPQSLSRRIPAETLDAWNSTLGAVITGRLSTLTPTQLDSFLRYRDGLSNVTVLTYDEVLERLKALRAALTAPPAA